MKLTVLADNNTCIDQYYLGEPAVSYYIEEDGKRFLFDAGYSDVFLRNAQAMGIDITALHGVILSHGHNDHTRGLFFLQELLEKQGIHGIPLVAHPEVFAPKRASGLYIGASMSPERLEPVFSLQLSREAIWLTPRLVFLGQIARQTPFEAKNPIGQQCDEGEWHDDYVLDDTALAYKSADGLVIITGCSHSGICNIISQACCICGDTRIAAVIGGLHLMNPAQEQLDGTIRFLQRVQPQAVYAAHCTDFTSKCALAQVVPVREVGVHMQVQWK